MSGFPPGGLRRKRTDDNQAEIVRGLKSAGAWVVDLSGVGVGCPDLLACHPTHRVWQLLEIKDGAKPPSARQLTAAQQRFHLGCPGPIHVVTSLDEALAALGYSP